MMCLVNLVQLDSLSLVLRMGLRSLTLKSVNPMNERIEIRNQFPNKLV